MENTPTHELNGLLLIEKTDANGRVFFWDVKNKKRAKLDGQTPVSLADIGKTPPEIGKISDDAPADKSDNSEIPELAKHVSEGDLVDLPVIAVAVALQAAYGEYAEAPGGYAAKNMSADHSEVELYLPSAEGGHEFYRLKFPPTMALPLTRIK